MKIKLLVVRTAIALLITIVIVQQIYVFRLIRLQERATQDATIAASYLVPLTQKDAKLPPGALTHVNSSLAIMGLMIFSRSPDISELNEIAFSGLCELASQAEDAYSAEGGNVADEEIKRLLRKRFAELRPRLLQESLSRPKRMDGRPVCNLDRRKGEAPQGGSAESLLREGRR